MISKNRIKQLHALSLKKHRDALGLFIAEGPKVVGELIKVFPCRYLAATPRWLNEQCPDKAQLRVTIVDEVTDEELKKASLMNAPQEVLSVFEKPKPDNTVLPLPSAAGLVLVLDKIQDPGNLGTIIRLADWFGIENIVCSPDTADAFGPKVVQSTMGALARVKVFYTDLTAYLRSLPSGTPIYGTFLQGENIYKKPLSRHGVIVMGNEGNGISAEIEPLVTDRLLIPSFPTGRPTVESLNVAVATAVVCAEFRRRTVL